MKFRFLDHTADVKFEVFGQSPEDIFTHCVEAIKEVLTEHDASPSKEIIIRAKAETLEKLLFDFISELIIVMEDEHLLPISLKDVSIEDNEIRATLLADDIENYEILTYIKAMTYNDMVIEELEDKSWRAVVVVDL